VLSSVGVWSVPVVVAGLEQAGSRRLKHADGTLDHHEAAVSVAGHGDGASIVALRLLVRVQKEDHGLRVGGP